MRIFKTALVVALVLGLLVFVFLEPIKRAAVVHLSLDYAVEGPAAEGARFDALDAPYTRFDIAMREVVAGFERPTELAFVPGAAGLLLVAEKGGTLWWADLHAGTRGELLSVEPLTASEQGLLGFALHPQFATNGRLYINYTARRDGGDHTLVEERRVPKGADLRTATVSGGATLLDVEQPYPNHNGGQLLFGPDGMLYVPLGDGGLKNDPFGHGQNRSTILGSIARLDVDAPAPHVPAGRFP